jgi:tetratricopeptide (TPR) repeat protein
MDVVSNSVKFHDAQGETGRSLEIIRTALAGDPNSRYFRGALAQRTYAMGDAAGAEAVLLEATETDNPDRAVAAWIDLGKFRQAVGGYAGAADALKRAVEILEEADAPNPQVLFEYADALVLADRLDEAEDVAQELTVPAHKSLILGRVAQERHDPAKALEHFSEALRLWPDNPWGRYYAAVAADELGDFDREIEELRDSIRIEPGATDARTRGAAMLLARGNPTAAFVMLQTGLEEAPLELEGQLLGMRLAGLTGNTTGVSEFLSMVEKNHPMRVGDALVAAAEGIEKRNGPATALSMLTGAPGVDFSQLRYAPVLRAIVRLSHEVGQKPEGRKAIQAVLDSQPNSSAFQEIRGLDLELSGAPPDAVRAAYERALALDPRNVDALADLGRLASKTDPEAAFGFYDRAATADPSDPMLQVEAARALIASGKRSEAEQRLDALLLEHPFVSEAAEERARLDLEKGVASEQTLERARRAVRFGGGPDALDLLSQVLTKRNEPELAARAAEEARALREAKDPEG